MCKSPKGKCPKMLPEPSTWLNEASYFASQHMAFQVRLESDFFLCHGDNVNHWVSVPPNCDTLALYNYHNKWGHCQMIIEFLKWGLNFPQALSHPVTVSWLCLTCWKLSSIRLSRVPTLSETPTASTIERASSRSDGLASLPWFMGIKINTVMIYWC